MRELNYIDETIERNENPALRIGAVMHWHGLLTINYDYETNTKKANKRMEDARKR